MHMWRIWIHKYWISQTSIHEVLWIPMKFFLSCLKSSESLGSPGTPFKPYYVSTSQIHSRELLVLKMCEMKRKKFTVTETHTSYSDIYCSLLSTKFVKFCIDYYGLFMIPSWNYSNSHSRVKSQLRSWPFRWSRNP